MSSNESGNRPRALITGASSGIGAAFAERLASDKFDLVIVARRRAMLDSLAERLRGAHGVEVAVLAADLARPAELREVEAWAAHDAALELLINNAGFGAYMPFITLDPDRAEELLQVQVVAPTRLTRAVLPGMVARGRGAIINVSSRLGLTASIGSPPLPKRATYAAAKAYLNTFTQILHNELAGTGVQVQALCPGVVSTEFHERVGADPARFPPEIVMSPADLVDASLAGLRLGEVICMPALADPELLAQWQTAERRVFEQSRTGTPAARYQAS